MSKIVCYVDYNENLSKLKKFIGKFFLKPNLVKVDYDTYIIWINTENLTNKSLKRLKEIFSKNNIDIVALSNKYIDKTMLFQEQNLQVLDGKIVMKYLAKELLTYIYSIKKQNMYDEELYITIESGEYIDVILDFATKFKNLNIVTDKIKKLKRLDKSLEKNSDLVYSISNNRAKSLRRANIIINFDFDEDTFNEFKIKRNSIIINLNKELLNLKNGFQGTVIEDISIEYENPFFQNNNLINFNKSILYESRILEMKYHQAKNKLTDDKCKIKYLLGKNGPISIEEIINNYS